MEEFLQKLNPFQLRAVLDESRAALVKAGVGSGKTTVLTAKVLYQHFCRGVPLGDMVVLTFTNRAADEIRERLLRAGPDPDGAGMPWCGTFHGVALKLLGTVLPVEKLGYRVPFTVLDPDGMTETAQRLIGEHGFRIRYRGRLAKRLEAYRSGRALYGAMKRPDDIGRLWECIEAEKLRMNRMDFDGLLLNATRLLQASDFRPRWIIVDEFQDCDGLQMEFLRAMAAEDTKLFAVGDPNQSIYGFRGGSGGVFDRFAEEYGAAVLTLPVNYRSSATILAAAKCFLEDGSALEGVREPGRGVTVRVHYNPFLEADHLAGRIRDLRASGLGYGEIAVFYRLQRQSKILEDVFRREGIPFSASARRTLKDFPVLQWLVRLLGVSVNRKDRAGLKEVLSDGRFGPGLSPARATKEAEAGERCGLVRKVRGFADWLSGGGTAGDIYDYFELDRYLSPTSAEFPENRKNVRDLLSRLERFLDTERGDAAGGVASFLASAALNGAELPENGEGDGSDAVKLMTLHACKGLEFRQVFIIGVNDGLIPLRSESGGDGEREEKRLFFVGITRARDGLELSCYTNPGDPRVLPGEGSYLSLIPGRLIDRGEAPAAGGVDLQAFRRALLENRKKGKKAGFSELFQSAAPKAPAPEKRRVRHPKYGEGIVESEDEETVAVRFEQYGLKSFSKEFSPLEPAGRENV